MTDAEKLSELIGSKLPGIKAGSLKIWGDWFEKPYGNQHKIIRSNAEFDVTRIYFDQGETLCIWAPQGFSVDSNQFRISHAIHVRWEWFYYGKPQLIENLYFLDFKVSGHEIQSSTNVDLYRSNLHPNPNACAVELV